MYISCETFIEEFYRTLENKLAVVTGAASGMGKEITILYAKEGASVVVSDMNEAGAEEVVQEIEGSGGKAVAVVANVSKEDDVQNMIDTAVEKFGMLDILVNNAGIMDNFMLAVIVTDEMWDKVFAVNVYGVMRDTRKALNVSLEKGSGVIVNIASAAYTASKHAVVGYTKNVGFQYANKGIRVNAIAPGGVNTNIGTTMVEPDEFGMERATSGAGNNPRSGEPEEIANISLFLASDDASFVNGEVIRADAGWMAY